MSQGRENAGSPPGQGDGGFGALEQALGSSVPAAAPPKRDSGRHATRPDGAAARASSRPPPAIASESHGQAAVAYASAGPQIIPSTRPPRELDADVPAVIVAPDEFPSSSRHKTARMQAPLLQRPQTPTVSIPRSSVPAPAPHAAPAYPYASAPPPPFGGRAADLSATAPRPRQPTLLMRRRGPSAAAKLFAFLVVLMLVLAAGLVGIVMRKPEWLGLTRTVKEPPPSVRIVPVMVPAEPAPPVTVTAAPNVAPPPSASAAPATNAAKPKKPAPRATAPQTAAPPGPALRDSPY